MATVEQTKKASKLKPSPDQWGRWTAYLAKRTVPVSLSKLIAVKRAVPLLWAIPKDFRGSETSELLKTLQKLEEPKGAKPSAIATLLEQWLEAAATRKPDEPFALETLAWCHALPNLAKLLPASPWLQLVDTLVSISSDAAKSDLSLAPLAQQLLAGELPLTLSYLLPEIAACKELAGTSRDVLSNGITELLDGEGAPHAKHLEVSSALFACWTRCLYLGRTMKRHCFTKDAQTQYEWLVRQMLRLCRNDGSQVLTNNESCPALFEAALLVAGDTDDDAIADCVLPGRKPPSELRGKLPKPAMHSEWAEIAVLRRSWDRSGDQLMVRYSDRNCELELNSGKQTVFSGVCNPELTIDGTRLEAEQDWEEICWQSDRDLDYLELELKFNDNWKVQRQIMLTRDDRFLIIADAVLGDSVADISHQFTLPLATGISFAPAEESREGFLCGRKLIAAVLPLQLPEWRAERDAGSLEQTSDGLQLRQCQHGQRLFAPLFIDLKPKRFGRQLTWRRLTVARQLEILPPDVAVGYRIQTGKRQWLVYRSLTAPASRSVLGQHFSAEFVLGRLPANGELEQLIEIE